MLKDNDDTTALQPHYPSYLIAKQKENFIWPAILQ